MKMRSFKTMAFWFAIATMANSSGAFADCAHHSHKHHSHKHHSHKQHSCKHPFSKHMIREDQRMVATALHISLNALNDIFIAEAFATTPFAVLNGGNPASIVITNPQLQELIDAVNGTGSGSIGQSLEIIRNVLLQLGVDPISVATFSNAFEAFAMAAQQYSAAVANDIPSGPYFTQWIDRGRELAGIINDILGYTPGSIPAQNVENLITALITDQANAIQASNGVLDPSALLPGETQSAAALRFDQEAHRLASRLGFIIVNQVAENANHHACPKEERVIVEAL